MLQPVTTLCPNAAYTQTTWMTTTATSMKAFTITAITMTVAVSATMMEASTTNITTRAASTTSIKITAILMLSAVIATTIKMAQEYRPFRVP